MFRKISFEKVVLGVFTAVVTLIAATLVMATPAQARVANPALLGENEFDEPSAPVFLKMTCSSSGKSSIEENEASFQATFVAHVTPSRQINSGSVSTDSLGNCFANAPSSVLNALGGRVDIHTFEAGGYSCKAEEGSVSFSIFNDRSLGFGRHATLLVGKKAYNCDL
ncbi:MAG: hypothetical protein RBT63_09555 [Bdellovibrionales bacterium]|jgi:hypothetical protein|nr:hypothetical protein [Bdellovibrionales bacterium]